MKLLSQAADVPSTFGLINPPAELRPLVEKGGAGGISFFLNNLISLIYLVAGIVFIFMLLFGAFQWLSSAGDKTKLESAQKTITNALIGITLFAVAFAIIKVIGVFAGFSFFR